jgi:hypothetical protein
LLNTLAVADHLEVLLTDTGNRSFCPFQQQASALEQQCSNAMEFVYILLITWCRKSSGGMQLCFTRLPWSVDVKTPCSSLSTFQT